MSLIDLDRKKAELEFFSFKNQLYSMNCQLKRIYAIHIPTPGGPQGADASPLPLRVAKTGKKSFERGNYSPPPN
jgi:hypothetical protein